MAVLMHVLLAVQLKLRSISKHGTYRVCVISLFIDNTDQLYAWVAQHHWSGQLL